MTPNGPTIPDVLAEAASQPRRQNIVFAAPKDDPRTRRPADLAVLVVSLLVSLLAAWSHSGPSDFDERVTSFFAGGLPGWISAVFTVVFVTGAVYVLVLIVAIAIFGDGRGRIARDMLLAGLLAIAAVVVFSLVASSEWPDLIPELWERDGDPSYPVARLAFAVAVYRVSAPYLTVPMRRLGRRLVVPMAVAAVVLEYGSVSGAIGGYAVGVGAAAAIHLIFGSGVGIPGKQRIVDAFTSISLDPDSLDYIADQSFDATVLRAELDDGRPVLLKVYGRDTADAATAARLWQSLWYRGDTDALRISGLQQVEHESLMLLEGSRSGAPVPALLGWGRGDAGDAVIATEWPEGDRLSSLTADSIDDDVLARCWHALDLLAQADVAHHAIDATRLVVQENRVVFDDFSAAVIAPDQLTRATDVAQMLVTTAVAAGPERAIAAARASVGDDRLLESFALLQTSVLSPTLRRDAKAADLSLKELRSQLADSLDTDAPELVQLARVTWGNVAMVTLTLFAAYALLTSLADIGLDAIVDELADAKWSWVIVALILAQLTNVGEYISLTGMIDRPVPLGPTIMVRYAISFFSLAVPSEAGAIALNVRYMQRLGVPASAAVAQGPLLTIVSKGWDIILLLVTTRIIGQTVNLDDVDSGPVLRLLILVGILAVLGLVAVLALPKLRARVLPPVKEALQAVRGSITDPARLARVLGGSLLTRILFAMTLAASVAAYGASISFSEAVFVNSAVGLFVGLMPVPGGIGVGEAALTAGLTAVGVPEGTALAAAITHRMVTSYLPPVYGWYSTRWLTKHDYL